MSHQPLSANGFALQHTNQLLIVVNRHKQKPTIRERLVAFERFYFVHAHGSSVMFLIQSRYYDKTPVMVVTEIQSYIDQMDEGEKG